MVACICHSPLHHQKPDFEGQSVIKASSYLLPFVLEAHRESLPRSCETSARRLSAESAEVYSTVDLSASAAHISFSLHPHGPTNVCLVFPTPTLGINGSVESIGVCVGLFKITLNGDPAVRQRLRAIVVCVWREKSAAAVERCRHEGTPQKKKDRKECGNYKVILLVAYAGKILQLKIIARPLREYYERARNLSEEQSDSNLTVLPPI